jgi:hypothetical protein
MHHGQNLASIMCGPLMLCRIERDFVIEEEQETNCDARQPTTDGVEARNKK